MPARNPLSTKLKPLEARAFSHNLGGKPTLELQFRDSQLSLPDRRARLRLGTVTVDAALPFLRGLPVFDRLQLHTPDDLSVRWTIGDTFDPGLVADLLTLPVRSKQIGMTALGIEAHAAQLSRLWSGTPASLGMSADAASLSFLSECRSRIESALGGPEQFLHEPVLTLEQYAASTAVRTDS